MANNNNIYKMSNAGGVKSLTRYYDMLAGNTTWVPLPYSAYDSIATVTVGSGGSSSITFSSIPATYTHLQIRGIAQPYYASAAEGQLSMQFNGDTGQNYTRHGLFGNGSTTATTGFATGTYNYINIERFYWGNTGSIFGSSIIDILDYTNTNKNKTVRSIGGYDTNGSGQVALASGLWTNTNAITSIVLSASGSTLNQYSSFALYGIKGN
jgi:hypothetical protein